MPKTTVKEINDRREQVYFQLLRGENPQQIKKTLNLTQATVYRDVSALGRQSREWLYDVTKGDLLALAHQRGLDGISLVIAESWRQYYSNDCPPKQKPYYLRLIKDCQESIILHMSNSAAVLAVNSLKRRIEEFGISVNVDNLCIGADVKRYNDTTDKYDSAHNTIN